MSREFSNFIRNKTCLQQVSKPVDQDVFLTTCRKSESEKLVRMSECMYSNDLNSELLVVHYQFAFDH